MLQYGICFFVSAKRAAGHEANGKDRVKIGRIWHIFDAGFFYDENILKSTLNTFLSPF